MKAFAALVLGLFVLLILGCNRSSSEDGQPLDDAVIALQSVNAAPAFTDDGSTTETPALVVAGLVGGETIAAQIGEELNCRGIADSAFYVDTRADENRLLPVADAVELVQNAITALSERGFRRIVLVGHNTGGLVAREAVSQELFPNADIELITFFTPFAGVPQTFFRPSYPVEFREGSGFITGARALPSNVTHRKIGIDIGRAPLLFSGAEPDVVVFSAQSQASVDGDARVLGAATMLVPFWPFGFDSQLRFALDAVGAGTKRCESSKKAALAAPITSERDELVSRSTSLPKAGTTFDPTEFAKMGLQAPTLTGGTIDPSKPFMVLVHGVNGDKSHFDKLEAEKSKTHNVFRFVYDESANSLGAGFADIADDFSSDTDDLETIADRLVAAIKKLQSQFMLQRITVVAHSMGGLVARRSMIRERKNTLAEMGINITLVTIATPFHGFFFANFNPIAWLSAAAATPGPFFARVAEDSDFIEEPGTLGTNIKHVKVETLEKGDPFDIPPSDQVLDLDEQKNEVVDSDPALLGGDGLGSGIVQISGGHVGVLTNDESVQVISRLIARAESAATNSNADDDADPSEEPAPTPTTPPNVSGYVCPDGTYNRVSGNCGVDSFTLSSTSGNPIVSGFPANSPIPFIEGDPDTRTATGIVILGRGGHTCTLECNSALEPEIALTCTNEGGGRCTQILRVNE